MRLGGKAWFSREKRVSCILGTLQELRFVFVYDVLYMSAITLMVQIVWHVCFKKRPGRKLFVSVPDLSECWYSYNARHFWTYKTKLVFRTFWHTQGKTLCSAWYECTARVNIDTWMHTHTHSNTSLARMSESERTLVFGRTWWRPLLVKYMTPHYSMLSFKRQFC